MSVCSVLSIKGRFYREQKLGKLGERLCSDFIPRKFNFIHDPQSRPQPGLHGAPLSQSLLLYVHAGVLLVWIYTYFCQKYHFYTSVLHLLYSLLVPKVDWLHSEVRLQGVCNTWRQCCTSSLSERFFDQHINFWTASSSIYFSKAVLCLFTIQHTMPQGENQQRR